MNTIASGRFTPLQRLLHWTMAVAIVAMLFIGIGMVSTTRPDYVGLIATHKWLGIVILVLALLRLCVRFWSGAPPLPQDLPEQMKLGAELSHYALYALMIGMPLIGWAMLSSADYPVVLFGQFTLPPIVPQSELLHVILWNAHRALAYAFFALILVHMAGGLFHALVRRDGVFEAMAPTPTARRVEAAAGVNGSLP